MSASVLDTFPVLSCLWYVLAAVFVSVQWVWSNSWRADSKCVQLSELANFTAR
jgi:hypothetical protein